MIVRGAFNHLLRPGLRRDFRDSYDQYPTEYDQFLKTGTQDRAEVEVVTMAGLPQMVKRSETEAVTMIDPAMSDKFTFVDDEFALGFMVSKKQMEDDLYGKSSQNSKWLGRSARLTQEYLAAALLDDAFAGATFTGLFNEALCTTSHTLLNAIGTWSNRVAGDPPLGVTGLEAALELGEQQVDQNGDPIPTMLNRLVVNIADEWKAIKITQGDLEPFTANNDVNAIRRKRSSMTYVVSHYKTQTGRDWFLQDPSLIDAHFLWRVKPAFSDFYDDRTFAAGFVGRQRINVYFFDQRGNIGSDAT